MKVTIDGYSFGKMIIGGREYTSDFILHADGRLQNNWWRAQGHRLVPGDIAAELEPAPELLIIGTGASGLMVVSTSLVELCRQRGIDFEARRTAAAVRRFNESVEAGISVVGCFHLTC